MSQGAEDASVSQKAEKTAEDVSKGGRKKTGTGDEENPRAIKSGKMGHESWVRAYLPAEVTPESTSFHCPFCDTNLSLKNISRVKQHLLNIKVCKFLLSEQAAHSTIEEIVAARAAALGRSSEAAEVGDDTATGVGFRGAQPFMDSLLGAGHSDIRAISTDRHVSGRKRHKTGTVPRQRAGIPRSTAHLRVGIIGAGGNTQDKHIPKLQDIPGVKVVAVANRSVGSAEKVCQLFDIPKGTGNWRDIIEDDSIDAVVIGTWPYLHKTLVLEALQAGKHVLTEARLAMNAREARELYEASLHHPHLVTQVVPSPFTLAMDATIAHFIADKLLGDLIHIDVVAVSGQFPDDSTALSWRQDIQYSGMNVMTLGIFYEPLLRWVGPAQKVQAMGKAYVKLRKDAETGQPHVVQVPDHLNVLAEMAIGAHAHFLISNVMGGLMPGQRKQMYSIYGSLGTLHVDIENRRLSFSHKSVEDGELKEIPWADAPGAGWRVEDEFIGAIRGTEKVHRTDFYTGVQYMEFTEAVFRSCQSGQPVSLPLVD
eukprot:jgi/Botrbrau1/21873/Bobra.0249s0004.1